MSSVGDDVKAYLREAWNREFPDSRADNVDYIGPKCACEFDMTRILLVRLLKDNLRIPIEGQAPTVVMIENQLHELSKLGIAAVMEKYAEVPAELREDCACDS